VYAWPTGWLLLWTTLEPVSRASAALLLTFFFVCFYLANLTLIAQHHRRYPPKQLGPILAALRDAGDAVWCFPSTSPRCRSCSRKRGRSDPGREA